MTRGGKELKVIAASQHNTGMVEAAIFATEMITRFNPRYLIMTGVLAGKPQSDELRKDDLHVGDIVIGTKLFMFEKGKRTADGFERELVDAAIDGRLIQVIQRARKEILALVKQDMHHETLIDVNNLMVHISPIGCSMSVVDVPGGFDRVTEVERKTKALEMESYGVARACEIGNNARTKALVVKSIMDRAINKSDEYKAIAGRSSALFVKHLIQEVLEFG